MWDLFVQWRNLLWDEEVVIGQGTHEWDMQKQLIQGVMELGSHSWCHVHHLLTCHGRRIPPRTGLQSLAHTQGQSRVSNRPTFHVTGLWEESGVPGYETGQWSGSFWDIFTGCHDNWNAEKEMKPGIQRKAFSLYGRSGKQRKIFGSYHRGWSPGWQQCAAPMLETHANTSDLHSWYVESLFGGLPSSSAAGLNPFSQVLFSFGLVLMIHD